MERIARLMEAATYDAWYRSQRGGWIGETEFGLLSGLLSASEGETLLDVGCGTGYFSHRFAQSGLLVTGLDPNPEWLKFARDHTFEQETWVTGDGVNLPFSDQSFDYALSVAALCFVSDQRGFLREMVRVARRRIVVGLLNRHSLLYLLKGRHGGKGAYRGARWHTVSEILKLFEGLPVANLKIRTAVFLPTGNGMARLVEEVVPVYCPYGSFVAVCGDCS